MLDELFVKLLISYPKKCDWLVLKEKELDKNQIGKYISALSNSATFCKQEYGYLIIGIKNHQVIGTSFDPDILVNDKETISQYIEKYLSPSLSFTFTEMLVDFKRIVVLRVSNTKTIPIAYKEQRYIINGSTPENLLKFPTQEAELFNLLDNEKKTITNTKSEYQELTFTKLFHHFNARSMKLDEKNLGFLTEEGKYNILAQLLSDNSHVNIRFALFNGTSKDSTMYSVREFGNDCLLNTLDNILNYGEVLNIPQSDETNRIVERKEVPLFDSEAFREATINAMVYNNWKDGSFPMFTAFSDRIEILFRVELPEYLLLDDFYTGKCNLFNEELVRILQELHIIKGPNIGFSHVIKACGKEAFHFSKTSVVIKIPYNIIDDSPVTSPPKQKGKNTDSLIIDSIKANCHVTTADLVTITNLSEPSVARHLKYLQEKGIIKRVGARKNGYWSIN